MCVVHAPHHLTLRESATSRGEDETHTRGLPELRLAPPHLVIVLRTCVYLCCCREDPHDSCIERGVISWFTELSAGLSFPVCSLIMFNIIIVEGRYDS